LLRSRANERRRGKIGVAFLTEMSDPLSNPAPRVRRIGESGSAPGPPEPEEIGMTVTVVNRVRRHPDPHDPHHTIRHVADRPHRRRPAFRPSNARNETLASVPARKETA